MKRFTWIALILLAVFFVTILDAMSHKDHFEVVRQKYLHLTLNAEKGAKLEFSDGSFYEIAPEDRIYTEFWVTPLPVCFGESGNQEYPIKITNLNTDTSVKAKKLDKKVLIDKYRKELVPKPKEKTPTEKPESKTPSTKK